MILRYSRAKVSTSVLLQCKSRYRLSAESVQSVLTVGCSVRSWQEFQVGDDTMLSCEKDKGLLFQFARDQRVK